MLIPLAAATPATCGNKAAALSVLLRAGLPVPAGVVVPFPGLTQAEVEDLRGWLAEMGGPVVAVRSSGSGEDGVAASGAGQYDSFLGVQGLEAIVDAVDACRASLWSARATAYRTAAADPSMAVIIQLQVDADVSGVMFTPTAPTAPTLIESSWGLGPTVVEGRLTPDSYQVRDGTVTSTIADKPTSLTRAGLVPVLDGKRRTPTLTDATAVQLAALGHQAASLFGGPQDIEWAVAADKIWLLQSRPITADLPTTPDSPPPTRTGSPATPTGSPATPTGSPASRTTTPGSCTTSPGSRTATPASRTGSPANRAGSPTLTGSPANLTATSARLAGPLVSFNGTPASRGLATGPARIVRGPADFPKVQPGDILVCPHTDPSWTPLLTIAAGVITESGGILSHAAIVAREQSIPAVVAVPQATTRIPDGTPTTLNGTTGAVHLKGASET